MSGKAVKAIGYVIAALAIYFFSISEMGGNLLSSFTKPSLKSIQSQTVELLKDAVNKNEVLHKVADVKKIDECVLVEKEKNRYEGRAQVWLVRKNDPQRNAVCFEYELKVGMVMGKIALDAKMSDKEDPKLVGFLVASGVGDDDK